MTPTAMRVPETPNIKWFHTMDLGNGIVTPGLDKSPTKLERLHMPADMTGMTFLDIGAWDGYFSFAAERRGASRVLATDSYVWQGNVPGFSKAGFLAAHSALESKVESMEIDAMDISPEKIGAWDVVLLAGVIYHVKNPSLCIERAASVTRKLLIIETQTGMRYCRYPALQFYVPYPDHDHNYSMPNIKALHAMIKDSGFNDARTVWKSSWIRAVASAVRNSSLAALHQGRCVVHCTR
jgi:tRNA (mo5U34)-methyltransferase